MLFHFIFIVHNFFFKHVMLNFPDGMNKVFEFELNGIEIERMVALSNDYDDMNIYYN